MTTKDNTEWKNPVFVFCGGRKSFNGYLGFITALGLAYFLEATYTQVMIFALVSLGVSATTIMIEDAITGK